MTGRTSEEKAQIDARARFSFFLDKKTQLHNRNSDSHCSGFPMFQVGSHRFDKVQKKKRNEHFGTKSVRERNGSARIFLGKDSW